MDHPEATTHTGKWKVEIDIGGNWENVWASGEKRRRKDRMGRPYTEAVKVKFDTYAEAKKELDEHLAEMEAQGMDFDPDEYRIVPVVPQ